MLDRDSQVKMPDTVDSQELGSWPLSVVRKQLIHARETGGIRRFAATVLVGLEVLVLAVVALVVVAILII